MAVFLVACQLPVVAPSPKVHHHLGRPCPRPCCRVMVLKKLGDELMEEYIDVLRYLGEELEMRVVVEPHDYQALVGAGPWPLAAGAGPLGAGRARWEQRGGQARALHGWLACGAAVLSPV